MATSFFDSWALWAKMSFILALAIVAVFAVGFGKLIWMNSIVKRQEVKDEEKRMRVEESRQSGQMMKTQKSQDIPFGIRAIQSGIQVDGIWQSRTSTPTVASVNFGQTYKSSNLTGNQSPSPQASLDISQATQSASDRARPSLRPSEMGAPSSAQPRTDDLKPAETHEMHGCRPSYKPRRSSHLRFGSLGEAKSNEDTHNQLESKSVPIQVDRRGPGGAQDPKIERGVSSGAVGDNKHTSTSETDLSLYGDTHVRSRLQRQSLPSQHLDNDYASDKTNISFGRALRASLPSQNSSAEYFSIPLRLSEYEEADRFILAASRSMEVLPPRPPYAQTARELTASGESQVPLLSIARSHSPFINGELHMNKTVRKVNSGFEVLPAGTFGTPTSYTGEGIDLDGRDDGSGEKMNTKKLQKKNRTSISSRRPSSTFESP